MKDDLVIRAIKRGFQFYYDPKIDISPTSIQHFNEMPLGEAGTMLAEWVGFT